MLKANPRSLLFPSFPPFFPPSLPPSSHSPPTSPPRQARHRLHPLPPSLPSSLPPHLRLPGPGLGIELPLVGGPSGGVSRKRAQDSQPHGTFLSSSLPPSFFPLAVVVVLISFPPSFPPSLPYLTGRSPQGQAANTRRLHWWCVSSPPPSLPPSLPLSFPWSFVLLPSLLPSLVLSTPPSFPLPPSLPPQAEGDRRPVTITWQGRPTRGTMATTAAAATAAAAAAATA